MNRTAHLRTAADGAPVPEPTLAEWRSRCLLAQSIVSHRLDTDDPDVAAVLAVLRGDLSLAGE